MKLVADDVQRPGHSRDCGHWLAEQAPEEGMLAALTEFLGAP